MLRHLRVTNFAILSDVLLVCPACHGRRYLPEVLDIANETI